MPYSRGRHRFWLKYINGNGRSYGAGLGSGGQPVQVNGWDVGIEIVPGGRFGDDDVFDLYVTGGSNGRHGNSARHKIGHVVQERDGAVFYPAQEGNALFANTLHVAGAE